MLKLVSINNICFQVLQKDDQDKNYIYNRDLRYIGKDQYVFIGSLNAYDLLKATGHNIDKIDLAYPEGFYDNNVSRIRNGDHPFWSYEIDTIFGRPLWRDDVWQEVSILIHEKLERGEYEYEE